MKLRVLSYNIHKGFNLTGFKFTLHAIRHALRETGADLMLLQEVVGENKKFQETISDWPLQAQFEFLADSIWPHYSYGKNAVFTERHHGNAILSRFPILMEENINISTNTWEQRGLLHCEIGLPELEDTLHVFNVHLDLREKGRKQQFEKIVERAKSHVPPETPFILGGDFNDWSESLHPMCIEHLGAYESHSAVHNKLAKSFPSFYPQLALDRLYYKHLKISSSTTLSARPWTELSDHLPLLVEFEIEEEQLP
ncbi:MAG: endonuclease/exonuclease/phosphatase family protein [Pseudobdellovibrionaceae bacterium]